MYNEYYGLVRAPFEMLPDPSFLYLGEAHREGLATLVYAVNSGKGFVMLTGEVGTGKTTLLHALLGQLDSTTNSAFIFNPRLDPLGFFAPNVCYFSRTYPKPWNITTVTDDSYHSYRPLSLISYPTPL